MACYVPINNNSLDISFFVFRPFGGFEGDVVEALKYFCFCFEDLGCAYSAVFKSIHGNLVVWYGAWRKRPNEKTTLLNIPMMDSLLANISALATILDTRFFEPEVGESKDGFPAVKFATGDILSMYVVSPSSNDMTNLSYACLALLKSYFSKIEGLTASVCLISSGTPSMALSLHLWKSLQSCYTWLLNSDFRTTMRSYLDHLSDGIKHDVFRVVYVSGDDIPSYRHFPSRQLLENGDGTSQESVSE